MQGVLSNFGKN